MNKILSSILVFLFGFLAIGSVLNASEVSYVVPPRIAFDVKLAKADGLLEGEYFVTIRIGSAENVDANTGDMSPFLWHRSYSNVNFVSGVASFVLGDESNPIIPNDLMDEDTVIHIEVDQMTATFPLPAVPYSIYSESSRHVEQIHADKIVGAFITTVNIYNDLIVSKNNETILFVDSDQQKIGIGKTPDSGSDYILDVAGKVNASGFYINNKSIEETYNWKKFNNNLYYNLGTVGIGLNNPSDNYSLHVSGNIGAKEYWIEDKDSNSYMQLEDYLTNQGVFWTRMSNGDGIYYDHGPVGIGTSTNIVESLVVSGAIKLSSTVQPHGNIRGGTIEYTNRIGDNGVYDFYAHLEDEHGIVSPYSLSGIRVDSAVSDTFDYLGAVPYFINSSRVGVTNNFRIVTDNTGFLGVAIGTDNTTAALTISGDGNSNYLEVMSDQNEPLFIVNQLGSISIGTLNVVDDAMLSVAGIVDADDFLRNGQPLSSSLAENSFWKIGTTHYGQAGDVGTDLFYEAGFVGIGTDSPQNMLELSADDGQVALTFDINDTDLFSLGITSSNASTFVISQGSDLSDPIFSFDSSNIGVGVDQAIVNLHVSGNAGFLVEGNFDSTISFESLFDRFVSGSALFYFPVNGSFRAGYASDDQWDFDSLGDFSASFGYDNIASGDYSFIGGGLNNTAFGDYSVVPGGFNNRASGKYSFAAGYYARALHDGTFVWADTTSSVNVFESFAKNQFLIRAYGGVGINTNQTQDSSFVVQNDGVGNIFELKNSIMNDQRIVVSSEGQLLMGDMTVNQFSHEDLKVAIDGRVGLGTTKPDALLHIEGDVDEDGYLVYIRSSSNSSSSSNVFVITNTGNVGIGTAVPEVSLSVSGSIKADAFFVVDPNDPSAVIQLEPSPGSPFTLVAGDGIQQNAYRTRGFIGLGTRTPNSLLELSNQNEVAAMPIITFDYNNSDIVKMGLITSNVGTFFAIAPSHNFTSENATFVVTNNSVIIGRGIVDSNYSLDVSGDFKIDGKLAIATDNVHPDYDVYVGGSLAVSTLNIAGQDFSFPGDNMWESNGTSLYPSNNYSVAIGTRNANAALVVSGSVRVDDLHVSGNRFSLDGNLQTQRLLLQDHMDANNYGAVYVNGGDLKFEYDGVVKELTSPLTTRVDNVYSGPLSFWVTDGSLSYSSLYWNGVDKELTMSSNLIINNYEVSPDGLQVSTNVSFLDDVGMNIAATLDHSGNSAVATDYSLYKLDLNIEEDWGKQDDKLSLRGIDLSIANTGSSVFNTAAVVGVYVDVTSINVGESQRGNIYAAKFLGGNVGIGVEEPSVALEVAGVVSANYFNLTSGVEIPELIVDEEVYGLVVKQRGLKPAVGIGVSEPYLSLEVAGTISANIMTVSGVQLSTINVADGAFVIDVSGNIGIGTTQPSASFQIDKVLNSNPSNPYIGENIVIEIDGVDRLGQEFYFSQDLTGVRLDVDTLESSFVRENVVKGMDIDLVSVNLQADSKLYGLYVDVTPLGGVTQNRYPAVFMGGNVGIGTANPTAALEVSGSIKADSLILSQGLTIDGSVTINNHLFVQNIASLNRVSMNRLYVEQELYANSVAFDSSDISVINADFQTLTTNTLIVQNQVIVSTINSNLVSANVGVFSQGLAVGTTALESYILNVDGAVRANSATFTDYLIVPTLSVAKVGSDTSFFVGDQKVGIGTDRPDSALHVISSAGSFESQNTETWNALKLGVDSDVMGQTVGLLFSPDSVVSQNIGSGILAYKNNTAESSLLFITDPYQGDPAVRMIVSSEGSVGIGVISPATSIAETFYVAGTSKFVGDVDMQRLKVAIIEATTEELLISANQGTTFHGDVDFNRGLNIDNGLVFSDDYDAHPNVNQIQFDDGGFLYVYQNNLYFINKEGTPKNISSVYTGTPFNIPYFDHLGNVSDIIPLSFSGNTLVIGTPNGLTTVALESTIVENANAVQEIIVTFDNRTDPSTARFMALDINMESKEASNPLFNGRLGVGETAIGLNVDLSNLAGTNKYAAIFNAGNVGIGITEPSALLHVVDETDDLLRLDGDEGYPILLVTSTGNLGIGTLTPDALLSIEKPVSYTNNLFKIASGNTNFLTVDSDGDLVVAGDVLAANGIFNVVSANALSIANGLFLVSSNGDIAIGTNNVDSGSVTIYSVIDSNDGSNYIGEKLDISLDFSAGEAPEGNWSGDYTYNSDLTGFSIELETAENNQFGDSNNSVVATGVSINMSNLALGDAANAYGLYVDVGNESTERGTRYGGYFSGNVGIGVTIPTYALTVDGNIYSTGLVVKSGVVSANSLTVNSMIVTDELNVYGNVDINGSLTASTVSVNKLIVTGEAQAGTGVYGEVTINEQLLIDADSKLIVGLDQTDFANTNGYIAYISGNVTVNGVLDVNELNVNSISALNTTINISGIVSANQMIVGTTISSNMLVFQNQLTDSSIENSLFVKNNDLFFKGGSNVPISLTSFLQGEDGFIPIYLNNTLSSDIVPLKFLSNALTLGGDVGGSPQNLGLRIVGEVSGGQDYIGHSVSVTLNGVTNGNQTFTGYKLKMESENYSDNQDNANQMGRLYAGDVAIGLHVDMKNSLGDFFGVGNDDIRPKKYAGLFQGGLVGIGIDTPEATLHVKQGANLFGIEKDIFRVDTLDTNFSFLVNKEGLVGVGTDAPDAQLTIQTQSNSTTGAFVVKNNSGNPLFAVSENVGIGINPEENGGAKLTVSGDVNFKTSSTDSLYISEKKVGIGITNPVALLDIEQTLNSDHIMRFSNATNDVMYINKDADFYFGEFDYTAMDSTKFFEFNVVDPTSSIVMVAKDNSTGLLNSALGDVPYGFLAENDSQALFVGIITPNESHIIFNDTFKIYKNGYSSDSLQFSNNAVGIKVTPVQDIALKIKETLKVGADYFVVDSDGNVGIGKIPDDSTVSLDVKGSLKAGSLEITGGGIEVTTANIYGKLDIEDIVKVPNEDYASALVSVNLGVDLTQSLYGLKINMQSLETPDTDEDPYYLMAGNADAYGIHVDMSDLKAADETSGTYMEDYFGNKYAAVFKGGAVGIGTTTPKYPLEVNGESGSVIAGFGSVQSGMLIRDWGSGRLGWNVVNYAQNSSLEHVGITIRPSAADGTGYVPAFVGIGTTNPDKALVVNGDIRIGVQSNNPVSGKWGRYGSKLFFSGGPSYGLDSDNGDDLWMARYNASAKQSRLRVNFSTVDVATNDEAGIADGTDMFVVGYTDATLYKPVLKVHNNSRVTIWGDEEDQASALSYIPDTTLFVRGSGSTNESSLGQYTALMERTGSDGTGVLALSYSNTGVTSLDERSKFIGFYNANSLVGSIEGNGASGIRYVTTGADYAEYLEKKVKEEVFEKGDIVSVVNGFITKDTSNFQQLMVLSSAAAVAGNWPRGSKDDFELIAFYGQVPTKVKGKVSKGDFIIAGFGNDGIGIAKSMDSLTTQDRTRIVGRAWESSKERGVKLVNTAVGFAFGNDSLNDEMEQLSQLNKQLTKLQSDRKSLLANYQKTLDKQSKQIESLLLKLEKSR